MLEPVLAGLAGPRHRSGSGSCVPRARARALEPGEVLVAPMTSPDWVPVDPPRRRARHRQRGHHLPRRDREPRARRALRRRRAPCDRRLHDGMLVTVDAAQRRRVRGSTGSRRMPGSPATTVGSAARPAAAHAAGAADALATRVYVNLALADQAERVAQPCPSTASGCCGPSSCSPTRSTVSHPRALLADGGGTRVRRPDVRRRCCASPGPSRPDPSSTAPSTSAATSSATSPGAIEFEPREDEPDDRLPRLLPLRARARPVPARARDPGPSA